MRFNFLLVRTLEAYAQRGATGATRALTPCASLAAAPSAMAMSREANIPLASFVRKDDLPGETNNMDLKGHTASTMESDIAASPTGPSEGPALPPSALETADYLSVHARDEDPPIKTSTWVPGHLSVWTTETERDRESTGQESPTVDTAYGSSSTENIPTSTLNASQERESAVSSGNTPTATPGKSPTPNMEPEVVSREHTINLNTGGPASGEAPTPVSTYSTAMMPTSSPADTWSSDTFVHTTLSTATTYPNPTPVFPGDPSFTNTFTDPRHIVSPAFIVECIVMVAWVAFFIWAVRHVWRDDKNEDPPCHSQWQGQEASSRQRSAERSRSSVQRNGDWW